jgi:hypothetical protein
MPSPIRSRFGVLVIALLALAPIPLLAPAVVTAGVVINEVYPDPSPESDTGNERVEIYNTGPTAVDMTGWCIEDAATINDGTVRCRIPEDFDTALCPGSVVIQPGEFRLIKGTTTTAWLNNTGDRVLVCSNRTGNAMVVVNELTYPSTTGFAGQVWACIPNGTTSFDWRTSKTFCASNAPAGDVTPPATVTNLATVAGAYSGEIALTWTAPGDDGATGTASLYEFKVSHSPITSGNFAAATDIDFWLSEPAPSAGGTPETIVLFGLDPAQTWYFAMRTQDEVPNTSGVSNSPGTSPLAGPQLNPNLGYSTYYGNLHSHTSYSDGVQTPADAYNFARNTAPTPLDFLAVTEHNHTSAGMVYSNYQLGHNQSDAANDDGDFVSIFGQEWGLAANGHVNIFEAPGLFGWDAGQYDWYVAEGDYPALYTQMLAHPPVGYPVIGEWCHPAASDFDNLAATPDAMQAIRLMALVSGPYNSTSTTESDAGNTGFDSAFQTALRNGMRVSPTGDQDNHNATWGAATQSRTAVLATSKTRSDILNALWARRCFATEDHNLHLDFNSEGHAMGEAFVHSDGVRIVVHASDPDVGETIAAYDLYRGVTGVSSAVRIAGNLNSPDFAWRELQSFSPGAEVHYYLRVRTGDNQLAWSGPIYVTYDPSGPTAVGDRPLPRGVQLAAHPNPFRGSMTARFTLPRAEQNARLAVYDVTGARLRTLSEGPLTAGEHAIAWDGRLTEGKRAPAGIAFLRLETSAGSASAKIVILN